MDNLKILEGWYKYIDMNLFDDLIKYVDENVDIIPKKENIFEFLQYKNPKDISVVIVGHEPYNDIEYGSGLAFSLKNNNIKRPYALEKIVKEIECTYSTTIQNDLTPWAKQGVLLINKNLIRKINKSNSCRNLNWNHIPLKLICQHSIDYSNIVYLLLGKHAHTLEDCIFKSNNHKILKYSYPTTDKGENIFTYSRCFLHINEYLKSVNKQEIIW